LAMEMESWQTLLRKAKAHVGLLSQWWWWNSLKRQVTTRYKFWHFPGKQGPQ
jgi:hypothetical protein